MDMAIVREVFGNYMKIWEILGTQDSLLDEIREKLPARPLRTGSLDSFWNGMREYEEPEPGHRHISHLYGLFPSELFCRK